MFHFKIVSGREENTGGSRLAYDFHREFLPGMTVASDFNPLLMLVASKVIRGKAGELIEFPIMPDRTESFAIKQKLSAPAPISEVENFDFVLTDATKPAFQSL
ncbi:MAG: hypothetical protein C5B49_10050 [Bdellovibrio sp.]|nr:MAG: hypothetical protein C5B49_10050 [Bdellovibrio sp.]